jgi:hypothetical protein
MVFGSRYDDCGSDATLRGYGLDSVCGILYGDRSDGQITRSRDGAQHGDSEHKTDKSRDADSANP